LSAYLVSTSISAAPVRRTWNWRHLAAAALLVAAAAVSLNLAP
jgi:hypothetical protein